MYFVYLIHFVRPYKRVQHYIGVTNNVAKRVIRHMNGHGSPLMKAVSDAGISIEVFTLNTVKTKKEVYALEHKYKSWHNHKRICPLCNPKKEGV